MRETNLPSVRHDSSVRRPGAGLARRILKKEPDNNHQPGKENVKQDQTGLDRSARYTLDSELGSTRLYRPEGEG